MLKLKMHIVTVRNITFVILKIRIRVVHIWNNIEDYLLDKCDVEVDEATEELLGEGWPLVDVNDL